MIKPNFCVLPILLLICACGNESGQKTETANHTTDANLPSAIYLEGLYATSTAPGKSVGNLFDADPATIWETLPGAGPDEGIMLYFKEAMPIKSIEVVQAGGSFDNDLSAYEDPIMIYTNGQVANSGAPNEPLDVAQNGPLKTLFIRFAYTGKESHEPLEKGNVARVTYPEDAGIAISELKLTNDKGELLRLAPPKNLKGNIVASSTLAPEAAYSPANLFDSRKESVWVEASSGSGEGETLHFDFEQTVNITAVQIWNGYQRSDEHFSANARVRDFEFTEKGGAAQTYTLEDTKVGQMTMLQAPAKGNSFELKIKSIYPGKSYKDLAISEIVFYDGNRPFILRSDLPERYQAALRAKAAHTPLAPWLDKRMSNQITMDEDEGDLYHTNRSLLLRADGTFVYYNEESSGGNTDIASIADGNWEWLSGTQLKVFGKWTDLVNWPEYYKGTARKSPTRIFKDVVNINENSVSGTKMLGKVYLK